MSEANTNTPSTPATRKRPLLWTNWMTLGGLLFVAIGLVLMLTFWLFELFFPPHTKTNTSALSDS